jgi:pyridoxamine 5'-phosphate oxidase
MPLPDLDEQILDSDPIRQFKVWFNEAKGADLPQPDAMALATSGGDGNPSARMVLMKSVDDRGFVFYTNYDSRKGADLASTPVAALVFYWAALNRQVRIEGTVAKVSSEESDSYFSSRPRESQLSALTSQQSQPTASRSELDHRFEELQKEYRNKPIPRPPHWGGYRVYPHAIEFWQSRFARLNDRVLYSRLPTGGWKRERLQP